jgi:hypothetical protein
VRNTLTFDVRPLEAYIKDELPKYIKTVEGLESVKLHYQDNLTIEEPIFPCFSFEIYSMGVVENQIDSGNIENSTQILLDLDLFINDEVSKPLTSRDMANDISYAIARFVNEKLGLKINQNDRIPNSSEFVFRKKIRANGNYDNDNNIIYTN